MSLTDTATRGAKPRDKPYKITDERGLFLLVAPSGGKWWRLRYRFEGREKLLSLGTYPDVTLRQARERRDEARRLIARGIDPSADRKAQQRIRAQHATDHFEAIAREWFARFSPSWAPAHSERVLRRLERDLFPWIGNRPMATLTVPDLLSAIRRIEDRGALETAHRALQNCGQVLRYAIATGRATRDLSVDLRGALPATKRGHFAAVTDPNRLGNLLRAFAHYPGTLVVRCALRLAPLVFVRPGELRTAQWADIDLPLGEWRYTVSKTNTPHIVPLSTQALAILCELHPRTGRGRYVFPSARTPERPMSANTLLSAMRRLGIGKNEMSGHGFRAMARTILDEVLNFRPDFIEHQLAHAVKDPNGRAYNRTAHLVERKKMMQAWADYLSATTAMAGQDAHGTELRKTEGTAYA